MFFRKRNLNVKSLDWERENERTDKNQMADIKVNLQHDKKELLVEAIKLVSKRSGEIVTPD